MRIPLHSVRRGKNRRSASQSTYLRASVTTILTEVFWWNRRFLRRNETLRKSTSAQYSPLGTRQRRGGDVNSLRILGGKRKRRRADAAKLQLTTVWGVEKPGTGRRIAVPKGYT